MVAASGKRLSLLALHEEVQWFCDAARTPILRPMLQFACEELVLPDGPYKGEKFKPSVQPYARLWLEQIGCPHPSYRRRNPAVGSDGDLAKTIQRRWTKFMTTGPSQTGKTLLCSVLPVMYHLFEIGETVIFALPDMKMADDKWKMDFLPAIMASRYRNLLPTRGEGSQGGKVENMITFQNGARLKFMSGGGGDKSRSAFTSRVLVVTEVDGFAASSETSEEASKLDQLFARTAAYEDDAVIYMENTVTTAKAPTWDTYIKGTASRIYCTCPHCKALVSPEREDLLGWQDANNDVEADALAAFYCSSCGEAFTPEERRIANENAILLHRGQSTERDAETGEYRVVGEPAPTMTFGFRWSGFNNLFWNAGRYGREEFAGSRATDEENAKRKLNQFIWAIPCEPPIEDLSTLDANVITNRLGKWAKGVVPHDTLQLILTADVHKYEIFWSAIAFRAGIVPHLVDYGVELVNSRELGLEVAIVTALNKMADEICEVGFPVAAADDPSQVTQVMRTVDFTGIDLGFQRDAVVAFLRPKMANPAKQHLYTGMQGYGTGQMAGQNYTHPKSTGSQIKLIGDGYHVTHSSAEGLAWIVSDADQWKTFFHARLSEPLDDSASAAPFTLYKTLPREHTTISRHYVAEKKQIEYIAGKGERVRWMRQSKNNHQFDCGYMACVLAHYKGLRLSVSKPPDVVRKEQQESDSPRVFTPDGRPFNILDRMK